MRSSVSGFLRGRIRLFIHLLGLVLLGLIVWLGGPEAWQEVSGGDPGPILVAFILTGVANMLSAVRLKFVAQTASPGVSLPWRRLYYLTMVANTAGLVLPRSVSTVGGKSVGLKAMGVSVKRSVSTVFVDNAFDLLLLAPLIVPGLLFLRGQISVLLFVILVGVICIGIAAVLWWVLDPRRFEGLANWLERPERLRLLNRLRLGQVVRLIPERPISMQVFALTIVLNLLLALRFFYVAAAVSLAYEWLIYIAAFPMTQLSLVIGGLGIFDASWYGVLFLAGVPEQEALTFVIAQRAYIFLFILFWTGISYLLNLTLKENQKGTNDL